jgi:putative ABC transport system ATP-binding protein
MAELHPVSQSDLIGLSTLSTIMKNNPEPQSDLICLSDLSKWYESPAGRFTALNGINLSFSKGEYVAVVGKSGSGKSTLLNMLTGIDHPSQGKVVIGGTTVHSLNEEKLAGWRGRNIGIVFQFFQLIPTLTISENLLIAMDFVNCIPKKDRLSRARRLLEQTGIEAHADKLPSALSGGEQQRAAIARALANDPPILVADEPTGNLDSITTAAIQNLFIRLVEEGKTVIVVTHEHISEIEYSRIVTLKDGMIIGNRRIGK